MTAATFDDWSGLAPTPRGLGRLPRWVVASVALHIAILVLFLMTPDRAELTMSDETVADRPAPVQVVNIVVVPRPAVTPTPSPQPVATDKPRAALPPRLHKPVAAPLSDAEKEKLGVTAIDPAQINEFVRRQNASKNDVEGRGSSWTSCSLLSPERRAKETACDGLVLTRTGDPSAPYLLAAPDPATLAAEKKYTPDIPPPKDRGEDWAKDRSGTSHSDEVYGKKPWE